MFCCSPPLHSPHDDPFPGDHDGVGLGRETPRTRQVGPPGRHGEVAGSPVPRRGEVSVVGGEARTGPR